MRITLYPQGPHQCLCVCVWGGGGRMFSDSSFLSETWTSKTKCQMKSLTSRLACVHLRLLHSTSPLVHQVINFVPQQQAWIVERFGKYLRTLEPVSIALWTLNCEVELWTLTFGMLQGLNILIPVVDRIKYVKSLKEKAIDIPSQSAITEGNLEHQAPPFVHTRLGTKLTYR